VGDTIASLDGFGGITAWAINYDYVNGNVNLVPVPEPASVLGIAAVGLGVGGWIRRRRSVSAVTSA
jgi:hypothetical protein